MPLMTLHSAKIICWVAENKHPFQIINDCGFQLLKKTGHPNFHLPSADTVSHDVKKIFVQVHQCIAKMLKVSSKSCFICTIQLVVLTGQPQEYEGALNFATDCWMSPNHKVFIAITVHFKNKGILIKMLLDLVEVARSHLGANLAEAFTKVLEEFGIKDKVSFDSYR